MVYRDYLPYRAAREYQDRKMAKWMGFFLSEHTTSLHADESLLVEEVERLPLEQLIVLLNQAFLNKLTIILEVDNRGFVDTKIGTVEHLEQTQICFRTESEYLFISLNQILTLVISEEGEDDISRYI